MMVASLQQIWRYPVKGLGGQSLADGVAISPEQGIDYDRRYGFAVAGGKVSRQSPSWADKKNFLNLAMTDKLAQISSEFDEASQRLTLIRNGKKLSQGQLSSDTGRMIIENALAAFLGGAVRHGLKLVESLPGQPYHDDPSGRLSLINLQSLVDFEDRVIRVPLHPLRFRGNLWVQGLEPWVELSWQAGTCITIGQAEFEVIGPIGRCRATNFNPETGLEDLNIPLSLRKAYNHSYCGVYLRPLKASVITNGDKVSHHLNYQP